MIYLTNHTINIPKGDSGTIKIFFKTKSRDFPYILQVKPAENPKKARIRFVVRDNISTSKTEKPLIIKDFLIDVEKDPGDNSWRRFVTSKIEEINEKPTKSIPTNKLYAIWTNDAVAFEWYDGEN